ncbi:MAG: cytidine deaminase [Planctomycetota bacterium]|jgi:cytidine deaminase
MQETDPETLYRQARDALAHAYAPYSGFPVGAAVQTEDGRVFTGANVENASYPLAICAERVAIQNAVSQGERKITMIAVAGRGEGPCTPCGACRQVIAEFGSDVLVVFRGGAGAVEARPIRSLLPDAFGPRGGSSRG